MSYFLKQVLLVVGLMVFVTSCTPRERAAETSESEIPLRTIQFKVDPKSREELAAALSRYAEKNAFAIRVAPSNSSGEHVLVQMWRGDVKLIAVNPFELGEYKVYFYSTGKKAVPAPVLDSLVKSPTTELATVRSLTIQ